MVPSNQNVDHIIWLHTQILHKMEGKTNQVRKMMLVILLRHLEDLKLKQLPPNTFPVSIMFEYVYCGSRIMYLNYN